MVFLLVFIWKAVLLLTVAQPVPANDAFFYDGPVVHLLNHGGYFNPSIAQSRPFSGTEFFCAYPPLYQLTMLAWMTVFGTSVLVGDGLPPGFVRRLRADGAGDFPAVESAGEHRQSRRPVSAGHHL